MSFEHALEYLECRCKSAMIFMTIPSSYTFLYFCVRENIMALKRSIIELVGLQVVKIIAGTVYIAGLTSLIPLLPLVFSPQELVKAEYSLAAAFGFIFAGFLLVYWFSGSHRIALRALGLYTLVPGILAVLFLFSPHHMAKLFRLFGELPNLEQYLQSYLPNAWFLAGVYIIVGSFLVWLSVKK